ncbi:MAG: hypothetical protein MUC31_02075 [Bacteroidales bacterium]|nr:hypothetical protein [Bacteroidales bacterium]
MKINNILQLPPPGKSCISLLLGIFLMTGFHVFAQTKKGKKEKHFEAEVSFATIYDNNILKYSDKYLERFRNNQDQGRFHIETYDDIILNQSAEISATYRIIKKLRSKFSINFYANEYMINDIKNWYYVTFGIQQHITKQASFKLFYSYIPHFYVRHFRDEDWVAVYGYTPETFVQFAFTKESYGFWIQNTFFKNTRVKLDLDYLKYYHNKHYTEYDCNNILFGIALYQPVHKKVRLELGYEYEHSDAKGYDEPGETKDNSDDADATYLEYGLVFGMNWELPEIRKKEHDLDVRLGYQKRYYLSEHYIEEDREHTGRVDDNVQLACNYAINLNKSLKLGAFYKFYFRDSDSESVINELYLSAEKDYSQSQAGLELTYRMKF